MLDVRTALDAAARPALRAAPRLPRRALVAGAAGPLGAAVLARVLACGRFERVGALVDRGVHTALRGFTAVAHEDAAMRDFGADTALVVFERPGAANGREAAFVQPEPQALPALAGQLHQAGVRRLVVAVPHAASLLPMALQQGLASLDEAAVAALGFDQVVFMRMARAQADAAMPARTAPQRLAHWMLSQLRWMIPQREQPVRTDTVAAVAAATAAALADAPPGTRVMPAALLWQAAQAAAGRGDAGAVVRGWLGLTPGGRL